MKKIKSIIMAVLVLVIGSFSINAQNLDDLRQKAYEAAIEAVNKGKNEKSAYDEYLERQELEAAKEAEDEALEEEAEAEAEDEDEEADTENNKLLKFQWFQEVEVDKDSDEEIELRNALAHTVFNNLLRDEDKVFKVYCAGIADYVWFRFAKEDDGEFHVDLYIDDNDDVWHGLCSGILKNWRYIKVKNTLTGTVSTAILIYIDDGNFKMLLIQDSDNPNNFFIFF